MEGAATATENTKTQADGLAGSLGNAAQQTQALSRQWLPLRVVPRRWQMALKIWSNLLRTLPKRLKQRKRLTKSLSNITPRLKRDDGSERFGNGYGR